jgi:hypothetical protein
MKKLLLTVVPLAMLSTACVPGAYPMQTFPGRYGGYPAGPAYDPARFIAAPLPVGRWDNVMMLAVGTPVQVLEMNGGLASGQVVSADSTTLRLGAASGVVEIAAADVMRIDRVEGKANSVEREAWKGAAIGAGAVGVLGLVTGRMPDPRLFLAGAVVGGYNQVVLTGAPRGAVTIYLAAAAAPAVRPGVPLIRRQEPR